MRLLGLVAMLTACNCAPVKPGCSPEENARAIAEIDKWYLGQLIDRCLLQGKGERATCDVSSQLEAERDAKVAAYEKECAQ